MKSYASRAQLAVTQAEIDAAMELEWDRRLITVLGSANNRLYEFRLQTANSTYEASKVCTFPTRLHYLICVLPAVPFAAWMLHHCNCAMQLNRCNCVFVYKQVSASLC